MGNIVIKFDQLNLPGKLTKNWKGKEVEICQTKEGILLKPLEDPIKAARGFLKGSSFSTERYIQLKKQEKALER